MRRRERGKRGGEREREEREGRERERATLSTSDGHNKCPQLCLAPFSIVLQRTRRREERRGEKVVVGTTEMNPALYGTMKKKQPAGMK